MLLESNLKSHLVCCLLSTNVHILLVMRSDFYDNQGNHNEGTHSESTRISSTFQIWYSPNYLPYARKFQIWSKTTFETPCIHWLRPWPKYVKKLGKMLLEKVSAFVCFRRVKCRGGCVAVWFWSVLLRTFDLELLPSPGSSSDRAVYFLESRRDAFISLASFKTERYV